MKKFNDINCTISLKGICSIHYYFSYKDMLINLIIGKYVFILVSKMFNINNYILMSVIAIRNILGKNMYLNMCDKLLKVVWLVGLNDLNPYFNLSD